ncbi:hypothetical protein KEF85_07625 [Methylomonas paludis]|uniref:Uncharacterized protein n=1 Tax=Methylomonas paludis TaxID=1173101 RepID=A0A975RAB5_9GAMM|nr:hypothetical protein [Methylomonas paludis]QWF72305.1 hypothetical protein KEF85_07625 [Methylomonas paludis]
MKHIKDFNLEVLLRALEASWSSKTSLCYNPEIAPLSYGQCANTAIVIFETFGGEILKTEVRKTDGRMIQHFYNRIDGQRYDFTKDQFFIIKNYWCELTYKDIKSNVEEAKAELIFGQLAAMRDAFQKELDAL